MNHIDESPFKNAITVKMLAITVKMLAIAEIKSITFPSPFRGYVLTL